MPRHKADHLLSPDDCVELTNAIVNAAVAEKDMAYILIAVNGAEGFSVSSNLDKASIKAILTLASKTVPDGDDAET